jgi:hypothetical protein
MQLHTAQWEAIYERALAQGSGRVVTLEAERLAATDELVAGTLTTLVRLGALAALCAVAPDDPEYVGGVSRKSSAALRMLDRALAAHGRDNGYDPEQWRQLAIGTACALAEDLADDGPTWMNEALEQAADDIALALTALPRDRMGVPAQLAEAIAPLLLVVAATTAGSWQTAPDRPACHAPR